VKRLALCLLAFSIASTPALAEDSATPHDMLLSDGQADTDKCAICHEEDMSLSRSKVETCTLCHSITVHAGASEHLAKEAARVARLVPAPREGQPVLPLTDDGRIYCGTCHVFHDPRVSEEKILEQPWVPSSALAAAVRESLAGRLAGAAPAHDEGAPPVKFSDGTKRLRLPIADGSLCRHCHRYGK